MVFWIFEMLIGRGSFTVLSACAEVIPLAKASSSFRKCTLCMRRGDPASFVICTESFSYSLHAQR